jgi:DNA-binding FadR family transcriptional regulator
MGLFCTVTRSLPAAPPGVAEPPAAQPSRPAAAAPVAAPGRAPGGGPELAVTSLRARSVFAPIEGGRAETVARRLIQAIQLGMLLDGERLPPESQLAAQFGVSPVTLREALAALRTMGLVQTRRGRGGGSFVRAAAEPQRAHLERLLRLMPPHELRDIADHRAAVAGTAARLAAERALDPDVGALREHVARLREAPATVSARRRADARIHVEIAAAAQSPRLTRQEMDLWSEIGDLVWLPVAEHQVAAIVAEHAALADAIEAQQPGLARRLAEEHVAAETERLLSWRLGLLAADAG